VSGLPVHVDLHIPAPPERHLDQPERWLIWGTGGNITNPSVQATAISIIDGWLILWRYAVIVAIFKPGTYTGAYAG